MSTPPASFKNKGVSRVRPAVVRPHSSSGFAPSFPALDEDPAGLQMEGWLALEDESSALIQRYDMQRRVVLVLGRASIPSCCVQLVFQLCFSLRFDLPLWTLPDPLSLDFQSPRYQPSVSSSRPLLRRHYFCFPRDQSERHPSRHGSSSSRPRLRRLD